MALLQIAVVQLGSDKEAGQSDSCRGRQTIRSTNMSMEKKKKKNRKYGTSNLRSGDSSGRDVQVVGLKQLDCRDRGFESHWVHDFSSFAFVVCCVGTGLCDGLTTRSEGSYRMYVCVCDLETQQWGGRGLSYAVLSRNPSSPPAKVRLPSVKEFLLKLSRISPKIIPNFNTRSQKKLRQPCLRRNSLKDRPVSAKGHQVIILPGFPLASGLPWVRNQSACHLQFRYYVLYPTVWPDDLYI